MSDDKTIIEFKTKQQIIEENYSNLEEQTKTQVLEVIEKYLPEASSIVTIIFDKETQEPKYIWGGTLDHTKAIGALNILTALLIDAALGGIDAAPDEDENE